MRVVRWRELETQIQIAQRRKYIEVAAAENLLKMSDEVGRNTERLDRIVKGKVISI
jgi:hypothetical protein